MTFCPVCQRAVEPTTALHPEFGIVEQCPTCQAPFIQIGGQQLIEKDGVAPAVLQTVAQPIAERRAPAAKATEPDSAVDLIAMMRARLAVVEGEIAKRVRFEIERDRLRRMLAAAGDSEEQAVALTN